MSLNVVCSCKCVFNSDHPLYLIEELRITVNGLKSSECRKCMKLLRMAFTINYDFKHISLKSL